MIRDGDIGLLFGVPSPPSADSSSQALDEARDSSARSHSCDAELTRGTKASSSRPSLRNNKQEKPSGRVLFRMLTQVMATSLREKGIMLSRLFFLSTPCDDDGRERLAQGLSRRRREAIASHSHRRCRVKDGDEWFALCTGALGHARFCVLFFQGCGSECQPGEEGIRLEELCGGWLPRSR